MEELVSVIVPVYNVQDYLSKCVESICNQTYTNLEIILADDGSTDQSGQICDEYAANDNRIKVVHKHNGGAADTRNAGLRAASGEYIVFVDSDDFIHLEFIDILIRIMHDKDADIAVTDFLLYHENEEYNDIELTKDDFDYAIVLNEKCLYDNDFIRTETVRFTVPWGKIYKRSLFDGIFYPVGRTNEDTHTTWRVMEKANKVVYFKKPLYYWRENMNSVTRGTFSLSQLSGLDAFKDQIDYYHELGKQRYVEIVFEQYRNWFFWCYNEMQKAGIDYKKELKPYYMYMREKVGYIKLTKSLGFKEWIKYRYLVWYKIRKILRE